MGVNSIKRSVLYSKNPFEIERGNPMGYNRAFRYLQETPILARK
jgi:hypothetical protein